MNYAYPKQSLRLLATVAGLAVGLLCPATGLAQTASIESESDPIYPAVETFYLTVNSSEDGPVVADETLSLREAIELTNGTLLVANLSDQERQQVSRTTDHSTIAFDLPQGDTVIALGAILPDLMQPDLVLDGTTQPGYDATKSATAEIEIPIPVVELTSAQNSEVLRGLTVVADNIVIRGLSLYGFTSAHRATTTTPPADIFIAHRLPPPDISEQWVPSRYFSFGSENVPPQGILIEDNWLGMPPSEAIPDVPSAFGVSIFNSKGVTVRHNRISYHDGSGIITGARAENSNIIENLVVCQYKIYI